MESQSCYLVLKDYAYAEWFPSKRKAMNTLPHVQAYFNISVLSYDDWYLSEFYPNYFWRIRLDIYAVMEQRRKNWKNCWVTTEQYKAWRKKKDQEEIKHLM